MFEVEQREIELLRDIANKALELKNSIEHLPELAPTANNELMVLADNWDTYNAEIALDPP